MTYQEILEAITRHRAHPIVAPDMAEMQRKFNDIERKFNDIEWALQTLGVGFAGPRRETSRGKTAMTNRRDFIKFLALTAAGAAALPQQIEAFEKYYEANTPFADELIAIDEIIVSGTASHSVPLTCEFYKNDKAVIKFGVNIFGGIVRWQAAPDQKIIVGAPDFFWRVIPPENKEVDFSQFIGTISFVDSKYVRHTVDIKTPEGSLV